MDKLYYISSGHKDGLGGNFRHMIKAQIYAIKNNFVFINYFNEEIPHSQPFYKIFSIFNNCPKIRDIPDRSKIIVYGDHLRKDCLDKIKSLYENKNFEYIIWEKDKIYQKINKLDFCQKLREVHQEIFHRRINNNYNLCDKNKFNIAIHIRRGDVLRKIQDGSRLDYKKRFTDDEVYINILKKIIPYISKNYKIILFSEGNIEEFIEFKKKFPNINLQIDKEEWRYIINDEIFEHPEYNIAIDNMKKLIITCTTANIFLGAKSHLSILMGYLNKNISLFENFFNEDLYKLEKIYKFDDFKNNCEKINKEIRNILNN